MVGVSVLYEDDATWVFIGQAAAVIAIFFGCPEHHSQGIGFCYSCLFVDILYSSEKTFRLSGNLIDTSDRIIRRVKAFQAKLINQLIKACFVFQHMGHLSREAP